MAERKKCTFELSEVLIDRVDEICYALGVPRNAWVTFGLATITLRMLPFVVQGKKRARMVRDLEKILQDLLKGLKAAQ
jgi:hypothetical protein